MKDADKDAERPVCVHSCCSHCRLWGQAQGARDPILHSPWLLYGVNSSIGILASIFIVPLYTTAYVLYYFDLRVRKEKNVIAAEF